MIPERVIATWNPRKLCFDGKGLFWVNVTQTYLRDEPRESADAKEPLYRNNGVIPKFENNKMVTNGDWIKVNAFQPGWVKRQELVTSTCLIQPDK
jgi:hypothetical protein